MTEATQANPYNARKPWLQDLPESNFVSADSGLAPRAGKPQDSDQISKADAPSTEEENENTSESIEATPYQKRDQEEDWKKRYANLRNSRDNRVVQLREEMVALKEQLREAQPKFVPPKTPDELSAFAEQYPDIMDVVKTVSHQQADERVKNLEALVMDLKSKLQESSRDKAYQALLRLHPDFDELKDQSYFHEWLRAKPAPIRDLLYKNSTDVEAAASVISMFKAEVRQASDRSEPKKKGTEVKQREPSAAESVKVQSTPDPQASNKPKIWTLKEIKAMSIPEYERRSAEIDQAYQEGRVIA